MEVEKPSGAETWQELQALEEETRRLLAAVRSQSPGKKKRRSMRGASQPAPTQRPSPPLPLPSSSSSHVPSVVTGAAAVARHSVEVLDTASPDVTPRDDAGFVARRGAEAQRRAAFAALEAPYAALSFRAETQRTPEPLAAAARTLTYDDVQREQRRLAALAATATQRATQRREDQRGAARDARRDRAALRVQRVFRGYVARRRVRLLRCLREWAAPESTSSGDWVQVHDEDTGDVWFFNTRTQQSQWTPPSELLTTAPAPQMDAVAKRPKTKAKAAREVKLSLASPTTRRPATSAAAAEAAAEAEVRKELRLDRLRPPDALLAPDGAFRPQLAALVRDALLDTRFDSVSTVVADERWFRRDAPALGATEVADAADTVPATRVDPHRLPMVAPLRLRRKKPLPIASPAAANAAAVDADAAGADDDVRALTLNKLDHVGVDSAPAPEAMCFGCWSAGFGRQCAAHGSSAAATPHRKRVAQTMLLCRNWDLDVMRRRYRAEELQEIFLRRESSLRYDARHKTFYSVVEQRHPIYRVTSQQRERLNTRLALFNKVRFWLRSLAEALRLGAVGQGHARGGRVEAEERSLFARVRRTLTHLLRIERFSATHRARLPQAPITGYSLPERRGELTLLRRVQESSSGQFVDVIVVSPTPVPRALYLPRKYPAQLPTTFPLPRPDLLRGAAAMATNGGEEKATTLLPANTFIEDLHAAAWVERLSRRSVAESVESAFFQVAALTPVVHSHALALSKRPAPTTLKFATVGQKATPGSLGVGGLPVEQLIYQLINTYYPPQFGNFVVADKSTVSPGVSAEAAIAFASLALPPTCEAYVERPLAHPLLTRRAPTIATHSALRATDAHFYGANRAAQTGEQASHGFRTSAWAPQLRTYAEIDAQVFVPGQAVASLNTPRAQASVTTHADASYPFCEPSTRDNSTLDFYHLLLAGVVSLAQAQVFSALTVQEPGNFQRQYRLDLPLGHVQVSVYRSWAFRQRDTLQQFTTDDGVAYWYHRKTGQTFWERPLYEEETRSALVGGVAVDLRHDEEPSILRRGHEGATRRYDQGAFRELMLRHLETPVEAERRRRSAAASVVGARQRGVVPDIDAFASVAVQPALSLDVGSRIDLGNGGGVSMVAQDSAVAATPSQPSATDAQTSLLSLYRPAAAVGATATATASASSATPQASLPALASAAALNSLTASLNNVLSAALAMDRGSPADMIQLGVGLGMALLQSGAAQNLLVSAQAPAPAPAALSAASAALSAASAATATALDEGSASAVSFAVPAAQVFDERSAASSPRSPDFGIASGGRSAEPIGAVAPTTSAAAGADARLDHSEEAARQAAAQRPATLAARDQARRLKLPPTSGALTPTPDDAPPKAASDEKPLSADVAVRGAVPVVAYPELSSRPADGAPPVYARRPPAGDNVSFVSAAAASTQSRVSADAPQLRRAALPLPVGFFAAIEAKHVATAEADYLPQVPNLPTTRSIGRVKPRSAAADWLMIAFDPWSAGRNPLSTQFVPSLLASAAAATAGDIRDDLVALQQRTLAGAAFIELTDADGLAAQRAEVTRTQIQAEDFRRLCSLCRHSKFSDAEQLLNQPDWTVPIDFQDDAGNTLLHVAAQNGSKRLAKLCLRRGAALNLQNLNGQTALHFAYAYGYEDLGEYLISKGADDSLRNRDGLTCYEGLGARELERL